MKMKKLLVFLVSVGLVLGLVSSAASQERKQVAINILGAPFGVAGYIACFTLGDLINKKSPWLRATAYEGGSVDNVRQLSTYKKKRTTSIMSGGLSSMAMARLPIGPFKEKYASLRAISAFFKAVPTFISLDPTIKGPDDLLNKKIGLVAPPGGQQSTMGKALLKHGLGLPVEKLNIQHLPWGGLLDAVIDGNLDFVYVGTTQAKAGRMVASPALQKFLAAVKKPVYWYSFPPDVIKKARESSGILFYSQFVKAGALGKKQPKEFWGFTNMIGWWADEAMDDDIVYEITRIIAENTPDFGRAHKALTVLTPQTMGSLAPEEKNFHPGALKYYKEKGLPVGITQ
jgi:TRAP transporter TAXI family solute receptor